MTASASANDGLASIQIAAAKHQEEQQQQQQQQTDLLDKSLTGNRQGGVGRRDYVISNPANDHEDGGTGGGGFVNRVFGCFGHRGHGGGRERNRRRGT